VSDPHETVGQDVEQNAAQKGLRLQGGAAGGVAVGAVCPSAGALTCVEGDQPVVGESDAMGVALGGTQAPVTEQRLDHAEIRPALQPVGGAGVTQRGGGDVRGDVHAPAGPVEKVQRATATRRLRQAA